MKLNSGGAIPNPTQICASSDILLLSTVLDKGPDVSPWTTFIFAARRTGRKNNVAHVRQMYFCLFFGVNLVR